MLFGHQNDTNQPAPAAPVATTTPIDGVNPLAVDPATGASLPVAPTAPAEDDAPSVLNQPMPTPPSPDGFTPSAPLMDSPMSFPATPAPMADLPDDLDASPIDEPDQLSAASSLDTPPSLASSSLNDTATPAPFSDFGMPSGGLAGNSFATPASAPQVEPAAEAPQEVSPAASVPSEPATSEAPIDSNDEYSASPDANAAPVNNDLLSLKQQALAQLGPLVDQLEQTPTERFRTTMMMIQSTDNQSLITRAYEAAQAITDEKVRAQALLDIVNEINYFTQQKPAE
jgi:hypothetical protein